MSHNFPLFHLSFPIYDLAKTKKFYVEGLGCTLGRESVHALILDFFGHQIVGHQVPTKPERPKAIYPRHFGVVFETLEEWQQLKARAEELGLDFYQASKVRNAGESLEHHTFFLADPSENLLEFKHYTHAKAIFAEQGFDRVGEVLEGTSI